MARAKKAKGKTNHVPSQKLAKDSQLLEIELSQVMADIRAAESEGATMEELRDGLTKELGRRPSKEWVITHIIKTGHYVVAGTRYCINNTGAGCSKPIYARVKK